MWTILERNNVRCPIRIRTSRTLNRVEFEIERLENRQYTCSAFVSNAVTSYWLFYDHKRTMTIIVRANRDNVSRPFETIMTIRTPARYNSIRSRDYGALIRYLENKTSAPYDSTTTVNANGTAYDEPSAFLYFSIDPPMAEIRFYGNFLRAGPARWFRFGRAYNWIATPAPADVPIGTFYCPRNTEYCHRIENGFTFRRARNYTPTRSTAVIRYSGRHSVVNTIFAIRSIVYNDKCTCSFSSTRTISHAHGNEFHASSALFRRTSLTRPHRSDERPKNNGQHKTVSGLSPPHRSAVFSEPSNGVGETAVSLYACETIGFGRPNTISLACLVLVCFFAPIFRRQPGVFSGALCAGRFGHSRQRFRCISVSSSHTFYRSLFSAYRAVSVWVCRTLSKV